MQFPGYWVSGDREEVTIKRDVFDDTDLSESSNWKEAHQNEEPDAPHGYVEWEAALQDVHRRLGIEPEA